MSETLQIQLRKGVLEMCVLALLSREDGYAYDIAARLAELIGMGEGTIYPLMRRMQSDGLVTPIWPNPTADRREILPPHSGGSNSGHVANSGVNSFTGAVTRNAGERRSVTRDADGSEG